MLHRRFTAVLLAVFTAMSLPVAADEAARLAGLSKSAFMAEYEVRHAKLISMQKDFLARFNPEFAEIGISDKPITDAERAAMSCTWDSMKASGQLSGLAHQLLLADVMQELFTREPKLDLVDLFMNEDLMRTMVDDIPSDVLITMNECGTTAASQERLNFTPEMWAAFGEAAVARGYTD